MSEFLEALGSKEAPSETETWRRLAGEISYMNGFLTALGILVVVLGIALALKLYQRQKKDRDWEPPRRSTRSPEAGTVLGQRSSDTEPDRVTPVAPVAAAPAKARKAAVSVEPRTRMTRAQMKSAKAMAAFRKLDKDSSGFISRVELQAVLVHLPQRTADAVFQAMDTDGDGRISFKEFEERFYPMIDDEDESLAEGIDFDGAWLMEWPDGDHVVCHVSGNRFNVFRKVFQLRPDLEPPRLQWQDGTVQELEHCGEGRLKWKLSKRWSVQYLHWVRIPYCPVNHAHKMKLAKGKQDYVCTRCHLSRSNEWFWFCPLCSEYESALCPECAAVPPEPEKMVYGIRASYVLNNFPDIARFYTDLPNPDFYQMADVIAKGERGIGYQKICPRDGQPGCSIVDAVDERHRGKVTHFVSWCWQYKLNDFVSAISSWVQREGLDPLDVCLWVCFFCNNQYRILEAKTQTGSDELKTVFESHLASAGRMLLLLDSFVDPAYIKRAWCIFESYVCIDNDFPITIILPERARSEFHEILNAKGGYSELQSYFEAVNVRNAKASNKKDEKMIKDLIMGSTGFGMVNEAVKKCLLGWLSDMFNADFAKK